MVHLKVILVASFSSLTRVCLFVFHSSYRDGDVSKTCHDDMQGCAATLNDGDFTLDGDIADGCDMRAHHQRC
jgi:hypothetical protein